MFDYVVVHTGHSWAYRLPAMASDLGLQKTVQVGEFNG